MNARNVSTRTTYLYGVVRFCFSTHNEEIIAKTVLLQP